MADITNVEERMRWLNIMFYGLICFFVLTIGCSDTKKETKFLPDLPDGVQAISLLGDTLYASSPYAGGTALEKFNAAKV